MDMTKKELAALRFRVKLKSLLKTPAVQEFAQLYLEWIQMQLEMADRYETDGIAVIRDLTIDMLTERT